MKKKIIMGVAIILFAAYTVAVISNEVRGYQYCKATAAYIMGAEKNGLISKELSHNLQTYVMSSIWEPLYVRTNRAKSYRKAIDKLYAENEARVNNNGYAAK